MDHMLNYWGLLDKMALDLKLKLKYPVLTKTQNISHYVWNPNTQSNDSPCSPPPLPLRCCLF